MVGETTQKKRAGFDWQVCQSDQEWEAVSQAHRPSAPRPHSPVRRFLPLGLLLLLAAGGLRWYSVQSERAAVEAAIGRTVESETAQDHDSQVASLPTIVSWPSVQPQGRLTTQTLPAQLPLFGDAITHLRRLEGDVAVIEVTLPASREQPALRQTRVYRQTESGWQRIPPAAAHWGAPSRWEGDHLLLRYYTDDTLAVAEVATQLDARYAELHQLLLGEPPSHKLKVVVDPAQASGQIAHRVTNDEPLVVASPAVYLTPENISDAELLAQSVVLALLGELTDRALLPYEDEGNVAAYVLRARMGRLLDGVVLWQLWQDDLPLARWWEPVVRWVFSDARASLPASGEVVPSFQAELCAEHGLWLPTPLALGIPLSCHDGWDQAEHYLAWRRLSAPPLSLEYFPLVTAERLMQDYQASPSGWNHPADTVALATVLEYAAATYGPESIPLLLTEASQYEGWATLIPAVFGVSIEEFEAGWQAYLAQRYGVGVSR
jgi:hypothetical protein